MSLPLCCHILDIVPYVFYTPGSDTFGEFDGSGETAFFDSEPERTFRDRVNGEDLRQPDIAGLGEGFNGLDWFS